MKRIVAITLLVVVSFKSEGQSFTVFNYSIPEGLPSSEVYEIFQDKSGFLWFATDNGVVRFDGKDMQTFHVKDGLTDPVVFNFQEDDDGRIWFKTFSGKLCYYENGKIKKYAYNDQVVKIGNRGIISFAYISNKKELWFGVRNTIAKIDSAGRIDLKLINDGGLYYKTIYDELGIWWVFSKNHNYKFIAIDHEKFPIVLPDTTQLGGVSRSIRWNNKLFLSLENYIFEYDGKTVRNVFTGRAPIINLSNDNEGNLWVGYLNKGVERFNNQSFKDSWSPDFLKNKSVTNVRQDHEGGLWFSTLENGVYYVPTLLIENVLFSDAIKIKAVVASNDTILAGDQNGNLSAFNSKNKNLLWTKSFQLPIMSMFMSSDNALWLSTTQDIFILKRNVQKIAGINTVNFEEDEEGFMWCAAGNRIGKISRDGKLIFRKKFNSVYRSIFLDDDELLLSDRSGLQVRNKELDLKSIPDDFSDFKIINVSRFNDSTLLISTVGSGFLLLNKKTWEYKHFDSTHEFMAQNVYAVLKTDSLLWLATENGIAIAEANSLFTKPRFDFLSKKSGLVADKINFLVRGYNAVWAFADNGVSVIPATHSTFAGKNPLYYIKDVKVNEKTVETDNALNLRYTENNIQISFGYIAFNNPNILTRYRLSKLDSWMHTQNRTLQFSALAPGMYSFELEYSIDNIQWLPVNTNIDIKIASPWWKTWYYQLIIMLVAAAIIYLYFRNRMALTQQKQKYLEVVNEHQQKMLQTEIQTTERERSRIAKDLHDSVGTNLAALKMIIGQLLQKHHEPLAGHIENEMQNVIHETKEIIYNLAPPGAERYGLFVLLKNQIDKIDRTTKTVINFNPSGDDVYNTHLNLVILRVIQELVSNSLKHAQAQTINLYISTFEDRINIIFEDNGKGFFPGQITNGFGLHNIESRIESLKGIIKFESGEFGVSYDIDIPLLRE